MKVCLNKILTITLLSLAGIFVFCTATAFMAGKASFHTYRKEDPVQNVITKDKDIRTFKDLGSLRVLVKSDDEKTSTAQILVVTPWFSYTPFDNAFAEELSIKKPVLANAVSSYFAGVSRRELMKKGEKKVKNELKEKINSILEMGQISEVFFDDYIFFN